MSGIFRCRGVVGGLIENIRRPNPRKRPGVNNLYRITLLNLFFCYVYSFIIKKIGKHIISISNYSFIILKKNPGAYLIYNPLLSSIIFLLYLFLKQNLKKSRDAIFSKLFLSYFF